MKDLTLQEALIKWFTRQMEGVHTALPAIIDTYDASKRIAKVIPALYFRSSNGAMVEQKPIENVPVLFMSTAKWEMVAPLEKGDTGLLICSEQSIGNWLNGDGKQVAPEDATRFSLHDSIFIPGLFPTKKTPEAHEGLWMRFGESSVNILESEIRVKGNLIIEGNVECSQEVTAMSAVTPVKLSTHIHGTGTGPSTPPQPGA